jgi:two-component sensor histidine kinase
MRINIHSIKFKTISSLLALLFLVLLFEILYIGPLNIKNHIKATTASQAELAMQIASNVEFDFNNARAELEAIAELPAIKSMDKKRLDEVLESVNRTSQYVWHYFVVDRSGTWVSHPLNPPQVGLKIPEKHMGWVRTAINEDRTVFLDAFVIPIKWLVSGFATPIHSVSGKVVGVLRGSIAVSENETVLSTIKGAKVGKNGYAYLVSGKGFLLAHPEARLKADDFVVHDYTKYAPVEKVLRGETGIVEYEYKGKPWIAAYHPVDPIGWGIVVQQPMEDIIEYASMESGLFNLVALSTSLFGTLIVFTVLGFAIKPLSSIISSIREKDFHKYESFPKDEIGQIAREFHSLYTDLLRSDEEVRKSLAENKVLLQEVHHRVKNNMAAIISLLELQLNRIDNEEAASILQDSQNRIFAMSLVHENIFKSKDLSKIDLAEYCESLVSYISFFYQDSAREVDLQLEISQVPLEMDKLIPIGLIINEVITNSFKHAVTGTNRLEIKLDISMDGEDRFVLSVGDNGKGIPEGVDIFNGASLGGKIIMTLSEQLNGKIQLESDNGGTRYIITCTL